MHRDKEKQSFDEEDEDMPEFTPRLKSKPSDLRPRNQLFVLLLRIRVFFAYLWESYQRSTEQRPLVTKMASSFVVLGMGDLLAQSIETARGTAHGWDKYRTLVYAVVGGTVSAPYLHFFYEWLEHKLPLSNARSKWRALLGQLLLDQLVCDPIWTLLFFMSTGFLEGHSLADVMHQIRQDFWPTMIRTWEVWPLCQFINFYFVPVKHRVLVVAFLDVGWAAYLSMMGHDEAHRKRGPTAKANRRRRRPHTSTPGIMSTSTAPNVPKPAVAKPPAAGAKAAHAAAPHLKLL